MDVRLYAAHYVSFGLYLVVSRAHRADCISDFRWGMGRECAAYWREAWGWDWVARGKCSIVCTIQGPCDGVVV